MTAKQHDSIDSSGRRKQDKIAVKGRHAGQDQVEAVLATIARLLGASRASSKNSSADGEETNNPSASRETVESIAVAIILAFLFRGFVAEAFVIPTGSMAPTLRGRHMDIVCEKCDFEYNTGASQENVEDGYARGEVTITCCPICNYATPLEKAIHPNQRSFNGDRILVSKFAYQLSEPERWDVIVFKYPGNAKQNYIKRLVGLPGETLRIQHGDVHTLDENRNATIVRKPPAKLKAMLHVVDDTDHVAQALKDVDWPSRWRPATNVSEDQQWRQIPDENTYIIESGASDTWLRYRHVAPHPGEWSLIDRGVKPDGVDESEGSLILDYYAYNDDNARGRTSGTAWVGDLAFEADVNVQSAQGELLIDLVEGGTHFSCRIDVATGKVKLSIVDFDGNSLSFDGESGETRTATTRIKGQGRHAVRFSNCDDQVLLWVNDKLVEFDGPTTYTPVENVVPKWSEVDAGDLAPIGIGTNNLNLTVTSLRVLRDIYYLAQEPGHAYQFDHDYEYVRRLTGNELTTVMENPLTWDQTTLFNDRASIEFQLDEDQFFPLGDNSPRSKDARLWSNSYDPDSPPPYVKRELLIGKALVVYWPHGWRPTSPTLAKFTRNFAFIPNFSQMKFIR